MHSDRVHAAVGDEALERPSAVRPSSRPQRAREVVGETWQRTRVDVRTIVAILLIAAGLLWAGIRGLNFYGAGPVHLAYDADQPPLLLVFVGAWLLYRSRRR